MADGDEPPRFTAAQRSQFERQLAQHRKASLERSRRALTQRLAEHLAKLAEYQAVGGYTSSVETEIRNFRQQVAAIDDLLRSIDE